MLPSAHPCPQPKQQINRFSHCCTDHSGVLSGMPGHVLFPQIAPSHEGSVPPSNMWFLGSTRLGIPNGILISSAALHSSQQKVPILYNETPLPPQNCPFPWGNLDSHLIHGSLGPLKSSTQMASRWVQPFLQGSLL